MKSAQPVLLCIALVAALSPSLALGDNSPVCRLQLSALEAKRTAAIQKYSKGNGPELERLKDYLTQTFQAITDEDVLLLREAADHESKSRGALKRLDALFRDKMASTLKEASPQSGTRYEVTGPGYYAQGERYSTHVIYSKQGLGDASQALLTLEVERLSLAPSYAGYHLVTHFVDHRLSPPLKWDMCLNCPYPSDGEERVYPTREAYARGALEVLTDALKEAHSADALFESERSNLKPQPFREHYCARLAPDCAETACLKP